MDIRLKKTFIYKEANDKKRESFLEELSSIPPEDIVYSDESGIDDNEVPMYGWNTKGERCYAKKSGIRTKRYNIIAALNLNKLFAPFTFEGYSTKGVYEVYIERVLVPKLRTGMVIIIDNASFHKSHKIYELIKSVGCRVLFLPPYSPDLNPIEHFWSPLKKAIRKAAQTATDFFQAIVETLEHMCGD